MKTIKKIFSMMLAVAMLALQIVPTTMVSAEEVTGTITINNTVVGATYKAYKILTLETYDATNNHYIYRVDSAWKEFVETGAGKDYLNLVNPGATYDNNLYVTWKGDNTDTRKQAFAAAALAYAQTKGIEATATAIAETTTVQFTRLELGYYVIDSTVGSLCILTTTKPTATVEEKNVVPPVEKVVKEDSTNLWGDKNDAQIGDTVEYQTTITVSSKVENYVLNYVLYDKMSEGLTLNRDSFKITLNGTLVENTNYVITLPEAGQTYTNNGNTFEIDFTNEFEKTLTNGDKIVVSYSAVLNEKAVIGTPGNTNDTYLKYDNNSETKHDTTVTYTYELKINKKDKDNNILTGAEFELYLQDKTTRVYVEDITSTKENVPTGTKYYRVVENVTDDVKTANVQIEAGIVIIEGLDSDKYYLKETKAPTGYNKLSSEIEIQISKYTEDTDTNSISTNLTETTVVNYTGTELPETGGMGTVLFITIGSLLVLGFGVLLVTKLRMSKISA